MKDHSLTVEVPAKTLDLLAALASGYTMSRGEFIPRSVIDEAHGILWDAGYEYGFDTHRLDI